MAVSMKITFFCLLLLGTAGRAFADVKEYFLEIAKTPVKVGELTLEKITINGTIPGPTLYFTDGDEAVIHVKNNLSEDTSAHWHGLLLPGEMDGVPGLNGFAGIAPGETFTYRFPIRQSGTYWYHSHSMGQEQEGHYGSIVIHPAGPDHIVADRDYVVLLSDFHRHNWREIVNNLKKLSDYYQISSRTLGDFLVDVKGQGFMKAWRNVLDLGAMRMSSTDLADVSGYLFLMNGQTPEDNWTGLFSAGERVRLRFINASAMSFYDVRIPGLKMTVVAADGQNVEPVTVDEFRFGVAETYDVVVSPADERAYTIVAESVDRSGFALGTLAPQPGMHGPAPTPRPRALLTMADMGMAHAGRQAQRVHSEQGVHHKHHHGNVDHEVWSEQDNISKYGDYRTGTPGSGWADASTPPGDKALYYTDLAYYGEQEDVRRPQREIVVRLGGNMERYSWTLNGAKYSGAEPINLEYGERVRLVFINDTMMAHPMHLHGMFVQLENGREMAKLPNKHTVIVAPGDSYSTLLSADAPGEWAFHCHMLYHMMTGMMNEVVVAKLEDTAVPANLGNISE